MRLLAFLALLAFTTSWGRPSAAASPDVLVAQTGIGAKFGTHDPYSCKSTTAPRQGAITAALAAQYVTCTVDRIDHDGNLFLAENMKVEVGAGVPYQTAGVIGVEDIEPDGKIYAIRGSYDQYLCAPVNSTGYVFNGQRQGVNVGRNCSLWHATHATGHCYRTSFGDWKCAMFDSDARIISDQPPPR